MNTQPVQLLINRFSFIHPVQVDISAICKQGDVADMLFAITFTLLSGEWGHLRSGIHARQFQFINLIRLIVGNIRRFRRICEHIQSQVCSKRFPGPGSPPRVTSVTNAVSESSSCGSDSSERLSCYKRQVSKSSPSFIFHTTFIICELIQSILIVIFSVDWLIAHIRLKMMGKTIQYSSAIRQMWHVVHRLRQTIITKCSVNRVVQRPFDRGKQTSIHRIPYICYFYPEWN